MTLNNFSGIILDAGDVIYDATLWRRWFFEKLNADADINLNYDEFYFMWDNYYLRDIHLGNIGYNDQFRRFLLDMQIPAERLDDVIELSMEGKKDLEGKSKPYQWVYDYFPLIKKKGKTLAVLTDSEQSENEIRRRYREWGISDYIDHIITSRDSSTVKPYPRAYQKALDKMDMKAEQCIFIGHDFDELTGARNVGLRTINFFDREQFAEFLKVFDD